MLEEHIKDMDTRRYILSRICNRILASGKKGISVSSLSKLEHIAYDIIVEIVKEDILRIVGEERSKKVRLKFIKSKIKASSSFISESIRELKRDGLIRLDKKFLRLTDLPIMGFMP